jgi:hypothetical protein
MNFTLFSETCQIEDFRKESSIFCFTLIFYYVLTNLQFALKFVCPLVIREGDFLGDEVENLIVVIIVFNVTLNQFSIPYHAFHVWPALKKKIPLAFNLVVHLFLLKWSLHPRLVKDIDYGFKQEEEETFLFLS